MATITEKLVLKDVFSETFARYIKAAQKAASATADAQKALYGFMAASQITAAQQHASTTAAQQNAGAQEQAGTDSGTDGDHLELACAEPLVEAFLLVCERVVCGGLSVLIRCRSLLVLVR